MTQLNVLAILLLGLQDCDTDEGSERSSLLSHLDVGSVGSGSGKSHQNNSKGLIRSFWKSAQMKDDAENLCCLLNLQLGESIE